MTFNLYASQALYLTEHCVIINGKSVTYRIPKEYEDAIKKETKKYNIPIWMFCRLMEWESGFNKDYVSKENENGSIDIGLLSINNKCISDFAWRYNIKDFNPKDPFQSITVGAKHLTSLKKTFGNWYDACGAWNKGSLGYKKYLNNEIRLTSDTSRLLKYVFCYLFES